MYSRVAINHFTSAICVDAAQQSLTFSYGYSVFSGDGGETKNIWQARKKSFFLLVWTSENVDALLGLKPLLWLQLGMCVCICVGVGIFQQTDTFRDQVLSRGGTTFF